MPAEFRDGVVTIEASSKTVPHPVHADIYTLGECIPLEWSGSGADLQSRVVLYHGSFQALAGLGDFDWRAEAGRGRRVHRGADLIWHGARYRVKIPDAARPLFVILDSLAEPPPGEAVLVLPRRLSLLNFWRRVTPTEAFVRVEQVKE